jgi:hypothetical protein
MCTFPQTADFVSSCTTLASQPLPGAGCAEACETAPRPHSFSGRDIKRASALRRRARRLDAFDSYNSSPVLRSRPNPAKAATAETAATKTIVSSPVLQVVEAPADLPNP